MSRLHFGVILSESAYSRYGHRLIHARMFIYNKFDDNARERLWFMLMKDESYVVCRAPRGNKIGDLLPFVQSGLLLDLRVLPNIDSASSLHDYIMMRIHSRREYISCCHMIRNKLSDEIGIPFRWNGAELESIMHQSLVHNASYFTGLNSLGRFWEVNGNYHSNDVYKSSELWIRDAFREASTLEPGQAKLYSLMFGMAMRRDIIYVGSAPGTGWQMCLKRMGLKNKVYSFDPSPLDTTLGVDENIIHIQKKVLDPSDIWAEVPEGRYDFIWDVRGDTSVGYTNGENVIQLVESEIKILYNILECPISSRSFRRVNIKVKWDMINSYKLPDHARLFFLPFCWREERPINELRAVFLMNSRIPLVHRVFDYHTMRNSVLLKRVDDLTLFYNAMLMRLDPICFMSNINPDVQLDVNLFCINWNDNLKIQRYLSALKSKNIHVLSSYFTGSALREGEFETDESMLLNMHMQVFDSRLIVPAKLENLYFFTDGGSLRWYKHELVTAESFVIMDEEVRLRRLGLYDRYDSCRDDICRAKSCTFLKFPNDISLCDTIVSPSGHALRMATAHVGGRVSLAMFVLKIIYSFFRVRNTWVDYSATRSVTRLFGIQINLVEGNGEVVIEKLWHSYLEWVIGIECGYVLMNKAVNTDMLAYLDMIILAKNKLGVEVASYYANRGIEYTQFVKKREQHVPAVRQTLHELCLVFSNFVCDARSYILNFRINLPEWRALVFSLKADKVIMEICVLRSMYEVLSPTISGDIFLELLDIKFITAIISGRLGTDLSTDLLVDDMFLWKYPLFHDSYLRHDPVEFHRLHQDSSMARFVWHAICHNWFTHMRYQRAVRSEDLKNFRIPELPMALQDLFIDIRENLLPDGKIFSIDEVKNAFIKITSLKV